MRDEERQAADERAVVSVSRAQQVCAQIAAWIDMGQPQPLPPKHEKFLRSLLRRVAKAKPRDVAQLLGKPTEGEWPEVSAVVAADAYMRTVAEADGGKGWTTEQVAEHLGVPESEAAKTIAIGRRVFQRGVFAVKKRR